MHQRPCGSSGGRAGKGTAGRLSRPALTVQAFETHVARVSEFSRDKRNLGFYVTCCACQGAGASEETDEGSNPVPASPPGLVTLHKTWGFLKPYSPICTMRPREPNSRYCRGTGKSSHCDLAMCPVFLYISASQSLRAHESPGVGGQVLLKCRF